jgi:hypothetical protein
MFTLSEILSEHHFPVTVSYGFLTGRGADFLSHQARESRFFLIGEEHGIGDNLDFATALFNLLRPFGYHTYVTEIGPISARHVHQLVQQPEPMSAFREFFSKYTFSIPFAWLQEEVHLLQAVSAANPKAESPIIGIDQEFILSPQFHFETLQNACTEPALQEKLKNGCKLIDKLFRTCTRAKHLNLFMNTPLPEDWLALRQHFEAQNHSEAVSLIDALVASHEVYMYYQTKAYYSNNFVRSQLMKKYFYAAYQKQIASQPGVKFLVKLGANLIERGHSAMGVQDIGNFISELAVMENTQSFHLFVVPVGGKQNAWLPFLPESFKEAPIEENTNPAFRPLLDVAPEKAGWNLYDLRPLRARQNFWGKDNPDFKKLLLGYDAILLMENVQAAHLVI